MKLPNDAIVFSTSEAAPPPAYQPIDALPLVIVIGLTGVGKSTILDLLASQDLDFSLLPNRRTIADQVIIASLQMADGLPLQPVHDRVKRFEYTARYRAQNSGGMAHALGQIWLNPAKAHPLLIFDGLRGLEEVQHAVQHLPQARFVVLDATDMVRLTRLLKRDDAFDDTVVVDSPTNQNLLASLLGVPDIEAVFDEEQLRQIARIARAANLTSDDVVKKAKIIVEERRNYDPDAARVYLTRSQSTHPVLVVDTANHSPDEVATRVAEWLKAG